MYTFKFALRLLIICFVICAPVYAQTAEYSFDAESSKVTVDGTSNTTPEWTVYATEFSGGVTLNENNPVMIESARLVVSTPMMKSRKSPIMDRGMHAALKVKEFDTITYELTEVTAVEQTSDIGFTLNAAGNLTIGGETREVSIPIDVTVDETGQVSYIGSHTVLMTDYGLQPPSMMFGQMRVGKEVVVNVQLYVNLDAD